MHAHAVLDSSSYHIDKGLLRRVLIYTEWVPECIPEYDQKLGVIQGYPRAISLLQQYTLHYL